MACLISRFQLYSFNKCSHWTYASTAEQAPPTYIEHTIILCIAFTNSENVHMRCFRYPGATCSTPYLPGSRPSSLEILHRDVAPSFARRCLSCLVVGDHAHCQTPSCPAVGDLPRCQTPATTSPPSICHLVSATGRVAPDGRHIPG